MKGKWAAGIPPRNFTWVIKDRLAVSERPGGYARSHRPVRRQEEIIWLREQGFSRVISMLGSPHNLHAYEELGLTWAHFPLPPVPEAGDVLQDLYRHVASWLEAGEKLLIHEEDMADKVMGVMAGYLLWSGMLPSGPVSIAALEKMAHRQMGSLGRQVVALVAAMIESGTVDRRPAPATAGGPRVTGPGGSDPDAEPPGSAPPEGGEAGDLPSPEALVWKGSEIVVADRADGTAGPETSERGGP